MAVVTNDFIIVDGAGGEKIPHKDGPGITRSDLLDVFTNLKAGKGIDVVDNFIVRAGMLRAA